MGPKRQCCVLTLKRSRKLKNGFVFPEIEDVASVSENDFVRVLPQPKPAAQTKRLSSVLNFALDLTCVNSLFMPCLLNIRLH